MNCDRANEYIMEYLDGTLDDIRSAQLKQHLKNCKSCAESMNSLNEVVEAIEIDIDVEPPADFESCVMNRIKSMHKKRVNRADGILVLLYALVTSVLFVLSLLFYFEFMGMSASQVVYQVYSSVNSISSAMNTLNGMFNGLINVLDVVGDIFEYSFNSSLLNVYYSLIVTFVIMVATTLRFAVIRRRNDYEK